MRETPSIGTEMLGYFKSWIILFLRALLRYHKKTNRNKNDSYTILRLPKYWYWHKTAILTNLLFWRNVSLNQHVNSKTFDKTNKLWIRVVNFFQIFLMDSLLLWTIRWNNFNSSFEVIGTQVYSLEDFVICLVCCRHGWDWNFPSLCSAQSSGAENFFALYTVQILNHTYLILSIQVENGQDYLSRTTGKKA